MVLLSVVGGVGVLITVVTMLACCCRRKRTDDHEKAIKHKIAVRYVTRAGTVNGYSGNGAQQVDVGSDTGQAAHVNIVERTEMVSIV